MKPIAMLLALLLCSPALADAFVKPKFPAGWPFIRTMLDGFIDNAMDNLPTLIGG